MLRGIGPCSTAEGPWSTSRHHVARGASTSISPAKSKLHRARRAQNEAGIWLSASVLAGGEKRQAEEEMKTHRFGHKCIIAKYRSVVQAYREKSSILGRPVKARKRRQPTSSREAIGGA